MPAPMSMDLRLRIVRAVTDGSSIREAARRFAVSPSAAIKLMQTTDELWQAIGRLLASLPSAECANYLNHSGYDST